MEDRRYCLAIDETLISKQRKPLYELAHKAVFFASIEVISGKERKWH